MKKTMVGINTRTLNSSLTSLETIPLIEQAGFDAAFWEKGERDITAGDVAECLKNHNLIFQSIHAPFARIEKMWEAGEEGEDALKEQIECLQDCARYNVPIMVCHVFKGFGEEKPNEMGIDRFGQLLRRASELGIHIAFENTEGEKYLEKIRDVFWNLEKVSFCIDTGHELCYNRGQDMIAKYGGNGKLIATHLDDNLGITGEEITWLDDSHLMPFDGKVDWKHVAERLHQADFNGILMFELTDANKPGRHTHDQYKKLTGSEFIQQAYRKAELFRALFEKTEKDNEG